VKEYSLSVNIPTELLKLIPSEKQGTLKAVLEGDPRPSYQDDPEREYGMRFSDYEIFFKVDKKVLTVTKIEKSCQNRQL